MFCIAKLLRREGPAGVGGTLPFVRMCNCNAAIIFCNNHSSHLEKQKHICYNWLANQAVLHGG